MKTLAVILLVSAVVACSRPEQEALSIERPSLAQWANESLQANEVLLCTAQNETDYFYVSRVSPQALRAGSQLALSAVGTSSSSFLEQWSFRSPNGRSLLGDEPPKNVRVTNPENSRPFVESVSEYIVKPGDSPTVTVTVSVKRCPSSDCKISEQQDEREVFYRKEVCTVASQG